MILGFTKTWVINGKRVNTNFEEKIKSGTKIHTIRADKNNRWKAGNKIHFATGVRSSNYNCFNIGVCIGVQDIEIRSFGIYVDGIKLQTAQVQLLAQNDGFDNIQDFWAWFIPLQPFTGKIIHWTDKMY